MIKITVITVVYNSLSLLMKTVDSISLPDDVEYLVLDGASSDGTVNFLSAIENDYKFRNFNFKSEKDSGIYDAMNKAVKLAKGKYIVFMNAGDLFPNEHTLRLVSKKLQDNEYPDVLYGDFLLYDDDNQKGKYVKAKPLENIWKRMVFCHQSMYTKRELLLKYPFDIHNLAADHELIYKLYTSGFNFLYIEQALSKYLDGGVSVKLYRTSIFKRFCGVYNLTGSFSKKLKIIFYYLVIFCIEPLIYNYRNKEK